MDMPKALKKVYTVYMHVDLLRPSIILSRLSVPTIAGWEELRNEKKDKRNKSKGGGKKRKKHPGYWWTALNRWNKQKKALDNDDIIQAKASLDQQPTTTPAPAHSSLVASRVQISPNCLG